MCGIFGVLTISDGSPPVETFLHLLSPKLNHRGPDDVGQVLFPNIGIGSRKLSIVSPQSNKQPVHNEDKSVWAVMNGEIYNYQALKHDLSKSHSFYQDGDTEVLVHLYEEYGDKMAEHLQGMYAIAIWDNREHRLVLIRDRFGEKPLYLLRSTNWLAFASEMQALLALPDFDQILEPAALVGYMSFGFVPGSLTLVKQITKLDPGVVLSVNQTFDQQIRRYWSIPETNSGEKKPISYQSTVQNISNLLQQACVDLYQMSSVPVGIFLSGGLDSSIIAALLATSGVSGIKAFTIDYPSLNEFKDAHFASQLAAYYGFEHHRVKVTHESFWNALPTFVEYIDEPCDDPVGIPLTILSQQSAQQVKVVLCGAGADELFGGYEAHWDAIQSNLSSQDNENHLWRYISLLDRSRAERLFKPEIMDYYGERQPYAWSSRLPEFTSFGDTTWNVLATDLSYRLPGQLLAIGDRLTMAASIEARSPFLTKKVAEISIQLPSEWKINRRIRKGVLREIARPLLPPNLLNRPKEGFPSPLLGPWFDLIVIPFWKNLRMHLPNSFTNAFKEASLVLIYDQAKMGNPLARRLLWRISLLAAWLQHNKTIRSH